MLAVEGPSLRVYLKQWLTVWEMVLLTDNEKSEEKEMVLFGISAQTHVVDVSLHFCTPRNQLLY